MNHPPFFLADFQISYKVKLFEKILPGGNF